MTIYDLCFARGMARHDLGSQISTAKPTLSLQSLANIYFMSHLLYSLVLIFIGSLITLSSFNRTCSAAVGSVIWKRSLVSTATGQSAVRS